MSVLGIVGIVFAVLLGLVILAFAIFGLIIFLAIEASAKQAAQDWLKKSR